MNEIIKKNIVLIVVLGVSALASVVLLVRVVMMSSEMTSEIGKVAEIRDKIINLNQARPAPLEANLDMIKEDIQTATIKKKEVQRIFGSVGRDGLKAFAKAVGEDEIKLLMSWQDYAREKFRSAERIPPKNILNDFLTKEKKYPEADIAKAREAFALYLNENRLQKIPSRDLDDYLLEALGVQQKLSPSETKLYFSDVDKKLVKLTEKLVELPGGAGFSLFVEFTAGRMPDTKEAHYIIKHCRLNEDLFARFVKSGVTNVRAIKRLNQLEGEKDGEYLVFRYELALTAPLKNIRQFMNSLQDAYKDNRAYIVRNVSLKKTKDEVIGIKPFSPEEKKDKEALPEGLPPENQEAIKKSQSAELAIGTSNLVDVTLEFEYILFVGDEIYQKD